MGEAGGTEQLPWRHLKARFFGAPPRFFAQEQRNGVERAVGGIDFYPRRRRTRSRAQKRCCLVFALCVCADTLGGGRWPALPFDPISLVLAQRNGVEPPKKSAFLPRWLQHPRERFCLGCLYSSSPDLGRRLGGLTGRSSQLDAVGGDVGASSSWERRVGPNSPRGGTLKRVSLGLHPVSLRKSKEMGWNGQ